LPSLIRHQLQEKAADSQGQRLFCFAHGEPICQSSRKREQ
jgi:hypothetical protein